MDTRGIADGIVGFIVSLILFIIFAVIYFVLLLFVMKFAAGVVFDGGLGTDAGVLSAAILTAATLIGGGSLKFFTGSD